MKWFKHDSNANMDAKLRRLRLKYGMEGYGLYWYCLELIAQNVMECQNITFELEHDAEIIGADTGIHPERIQEMMTYMITLKLFESENGRITCLKMARRLDDTTSRHPKIKQLHALLRSRSGATSEISEDTPKPLRKSPARPDQTRPDQNKNKNTRASADALDGFEVFWKTYPKRKAKGQAEKAWVKVKPDAAMQACIIAAIETAKQSSAWLNDGGKYIPHPATWLNARGWEDEEAQDHSGFDIMAGAI